jgi:4-hydroxy-3-methylbut-2-enyl diphosphate reductase
MDIRKIEPVGFCEGVKLAINIVVKAINNEKIPKPIHLLGNLIHNEKTIAALKAKGVIILEGASYLELVSSVTKGTIITTAHGTPKFVTDKIREKGLYHIDTTCPFIKKIENLIKEKTSIGYTILLYGIVHHPEANFLTSLSDSVILINEKTNFENLDIKNSDKLILTNQTTVPYLNVLKYYKAAKKIYPKIELAEEVCNASRIRQAAIPDELNKTNLAIIVGDKSSNNTKTLFDLAKKYVPNSYLISDITELKNITIPQDATIAIASGTSVSTSIVNEIYTALVKNEKTYLTKLSIDDYLK